MLDVTLVGPALTDNSMGTLIRELAVSLNKLHYKVGVKDIGGRCDSSINRMKIRHLMVDDPEGLAVTFSTAGDTKHRPAARFVVADDYSITAENVESWKRDLEFVVTCSGHGMDVLSSTGDPKAFRIPLGVDSSVFHPVVKDREVLKHFRWVSPGSFDSETTVFQWFGFYQDRKGVKCLLDAYRQAFRDTDNVALMIHSAGVDWAESMKFVDKHSGPPLLVSEGRLKANEIPSLLSWATVGVFPSFIEGFGMCGLQSLACGVPVVVPQHTGFLEWADESCCWMLRESKPADSGKGIEWYETDVEELSAQLAYLHGHRDDVAKKARAARGHASKFTWEKSARALADACGIEREKARRDGKTTVVILTAGKSDGFETSVEAVRKTRNAPFDLIVVDNRKDTTEDLGIDTIKSDDPELGVIVKNEFWSKASTEFVACVDDDCYVPPDWLEKAVDYLRLHPEVGLIGFKSIRGEVIDHAGCTIDFDAVPHIGWEQPDCPAYSVSGPSPYVPANCMVARKAAVKEVGYFWPGYAPGWFEDVDLCQALWLAGWEVHVLCSAIVKHDSHTTFRDMEDLKEGRQQEYERWWTEE